MKVIFLSLKKLKNTPNRLLSQSTSIQVNSLQMKDLHTYPSDFLGDIETLKSVPGGVDVVFHPHNLFDYGNNNCRNQERGREKERNFVSCVEDGGGMGHETWVRVERLEKGLCGKSRPIFFRGVATIVTKLFNIFEADVAVFGKKGLSAMANYSKNG